MASTETRRKPPSKAALFDAAKAWNAVGVKALWRARESASVRFLVRRGADASYPLQAAVWRDDDVLCRVLLAAKPRLYLRAHGETPIFYAARLRRPKTLDLLIEAGADPWLPDPQGRSAVDVARQRRLPKDVIRRLTRSMQCA